VVREVGGAVTVGVAGGRAPIVGRVAMDACVIDLGGLHAEPGDEVVFFGDPARGEPSLADWVTATGLAAAEIAVLAGARAQREDLR
jgi:alanine racemase